MTIVGGVPFQIPALTALWPNACLIVEAVFGSTTGDPLLWTWTDITTSLWQADGATIEITPMGRSDEASTSQPAGCTFTLDNDSGNFTAYHPESIYYPYVRKNTPIRVSVNLDGNTSHTSTRYQGLAVGWTPGWDTSGKIAIVKVECAGIMRRIEKNKKTGALASPILRSTSRAAGLVKYAPLEDQGDGTFLSVYGLSESALYAGTVTAGADTTLPGADRAITLTDTSWVRMLTAHTFNGHWQVDWFYKFTGSDPASESVVMRAYTDRIGATFVDAVYGGGNWGIRIYDNTGTQVGSAIFSVPSGLNTGWWHWRIMSQDAGGGAAQFQLVVTNILTVSGFFASTNVSSVAPGNLLGAARAPVSAIGGSSLSGVAMAHFALYDSWNFSAVDQAAVGYTGENVLVRMNRLCTEEGVEIELIGSSDITMGPQTSLSLMALLREGEAADLGFLGDGFGAGLKYIARSERYNLSASLTADLSVDPPQLDDPFTPVDDDQKTVNLFTASRVNGSSAVSEVTDGLLGTAEAGVYEGSKQLNYSTDIPLADYAGWQTHLGTVEGFRNPSLSLDLAATPAIADDWLTCTVFSRIDVTNVDTRATQYPPGDITLVLEGWSETLSPFEWIASGNTAQYSPWDTGLLDSVYADCGATYTSEDLDTTETGVDTNILDSCAWTHADGDYVVTIGGEDMTVQAVSALTTSSAYVSNGGAVGANASTVTPGMPGGISAGNLLVFFGSARDTNNDPELSLDNTAWAEILDATNFKVWAKVYDGVETAPTMHFNNGAGDTILATIMALSGSWGVGAHVLVNAASQLNASSQNISYPGLTIPAGVDNCFVLYLGWKADDWTSVATLGGATEIIEASSTLGNDAGIVADYVVQTTATNIAPGSFTVTGGASAISRGAVLALRATRQTLTVVRSVNGVVKSHPAGEQVLVRDGLTLAW